MESKTRRILFVLPNLNGGGAERVAINFMRQCDPNKYELHLLVFAETTDLKDLVPSEVRLTNLGTRSTSRSLWAAIGFLRELKPDIVFSTHSRVAVLLLLVRLFAPKFKHIARMQNTPSLEKEHGVYGSFSRWIYARSFKTADIVVAQTKEMKRDAIAIFGLSPEKIRVLYNPIDKSLINSSIKKSFTPFPQGKLVAVASGRLSRQKGFDLLMEALPAVVLKRPEVILYILGADGGEEQCLRLLAKERNVEEHVHFLGYQENPYPYYAFCDIFILPSRWEGFPNVLLENYYLNTPLVATRCVPVVEQLVQEGSNGCLCDTEDVNCLSEKIIKALSLKREKIKNPLLENMELEPLLAELTVKNGAS